LPALSQAVLSGDALPAATTPLHLTDSVNEDSVAPSLVRDDIALNALARGIDTTGRSTAEVVEASWTGTTQSVPTHVNRSERVLPVLIADSTHGGSAQQRYNAAVGWRAEGGSWGVVLHLLSGHASTVESTLAALQKRGQAPGKIGTVRPTGGGGISAIAPPSGILTPPPATSHHGAKHHRKTPGASKPSGGSKPAQSDTLLGNLVATVQSVINGVFGILPHQPASSTDTTTTTANQSRAKSATTKQKTSSASAASAVPTVTKATRATKAVTGTVTTATTPKPAATPTTGLLGTVLGGLLGKH
jgi:hypothetical protein